MKRMDFLRTLSSWHIFLTAVLMIAMWIGVMLGRWKPSARNMSPLPEPAPQVLLAEEEEDVEPFVPTYLLPGGYCPVCYSPLDRGDACWLCTEVTRTGLRLRHETQMNVNKSVYIRLNSEF